MEAARTARRAAARPARMRAGRLPRRERHRRSTCRPRSTPTGPSSRGSRASPGTWSCASATRSAARAASSTRPPRAVWGDGLLGHQRKVHLPPAERFAYTPGDGFAAFDTPVGPDRDGRLLRQALPGGRRARWRSTARRSCARWPPGPSTASPPPPASRPTGRRGTSTCATRCARSRTRSSGSPPTSRAAGVRCASSAAPRSSTPTASILARTGARHGIAAAEVDVARVVGDMRAHIDHLSDRRPEAYGNPAGVRRRHGRVELQRVRHRGGLGRT